MPRYDRSASLVITLFGAVTNFALAVRVLAAWRSLKWQPESTEWESSGETWRVDGVKLVWALLSAYFAAAATVCSIGFIGVLKSKRSFVRFYRDYSIADFAFCTFFTLMGMYGAFHTSLRAGVCEELSRQPELMRSLVEMGLNLENCELWFERAVLAIVGAMAVLIIVRLHFLLAVSHYHCHLARHQHSGLPTHAASRCHVHTRGRSLDTLQRIYLLSRPAADSQNPSYDPSEILVYTPVPLSSLSPQDAKDLRSTAAWISRPDLDQQPRRHHRHHHRSASASTNSRSSSTGRISLPIHPNEGLLPGYEETLSKA